MEGLKPDPVTFIVSQSLGLAFGAILKIKQATTLASVTNNTCVSHCLGYYIQQAPFIVWFKYLSYNYYSYKLLLGVQYNENDYCECS